MARNTKGSGPAENNGIRGFVKMRATNARTGEVIAERESRNAVVDQGLSFIGKQITHDETPGTQGIEWAGVGTDAAAVVSNQNNLQGIVSYQTSANSDNWVPVSGQTLGAASNVTCQFTWSYDTHDANGAATDGVATLREVGLFTASSKATKMVARATYGDITKNTDVQVSFTYELRFQAQ